MLEYIFGKKISHLGIMGTSCYSQDKYKKRKQEKNYEEKPIGKHKKDQIEYSDSRVSSSYTSKKIIAKTTTPNPNNKFNDNRIMKEVSYPNNKFDDNRIMKEVSYPNNKFDDNRITEEIPNPNNKYNENRIMKEVSYPNNKFDDNRITEEIPNPNNNFNDNIIMKEVSYPNNKFDDNRIMKEVSYPNNKFDGNRITEEIPNPNNNFNDNIIMKEIPNPNNKYNDYRIMKEIPNPNYKYNENRIMKEVSYPNNKFDDNRITEEKKPIINVNKYIINRNKKDVIEQNKKTKYDAIYSCESLKSLFEEGWNYTLYKSYIERINMTGNNRFFCPLCMIGEANKGKTYILNLLTNNKLDSGIEYKTEGISVKFTSFNEKKNRKEDYKKYLLFDTAGRSEPLLIEPEIKMKFKLTEEDFKKTVEENNRDLKDSEEFMKNILIKYSKIIIVVVNQLSLAEQMFLYDLKNEENYKQLFVIHNIFNFKKREDMENYIQNTIINSIYFDLSKQYFEDYDDYDKNQNEIDRPYYFTEELMKSEKKQGIITHLILGDKESNDNWINNFNDCTIEFLKENMRTNNAKDFFDVGKILQEELVNESIIDEKGKINDSNDNKKDICKEDEYLKGTLKLDKKMKGKDSFIGISNFNFMAFNPDYIYYKSEDNSEFVVEIECAGIEDKNISITAKQKKAKVHFHLEGKKIFPKELQEFQPNEFCDKPFSFNFSINVEKEEITIDTSKETNEKKPTYENGIYRKGFPMTKVKK